VPEGPASHGGRSAIVLLGARVGPGGPSPALLKRADHAARLYSAGGHDLILASGGGDGPQTEAEAAARHLVSLGIPPGAIRLETASRTTWENIALARPILRDLGVGPVVLVTDGYHMPRARLAAWRLGLPARGSAAPRSAEARGKRLKAALREAPALAWYALRPRNR